MIVQYECNQVIQEPYGLVSISNSGFRKKAPEELRQLSVVMLQNLKIKYQYSNFKGIGHFFETLSVEDVSTLAQL